VLEAADDSATGAGPSGASDLLYFSSARKTGERVSLKPFAGTEPQFPKRLSNHSAGGANRSLIGYSGGICVGKEDFFRHLVNPLFVDP
jgi:hypothetical protein